MVSASGLNIKVEYPAPSFLKHQTFCDFDRIPNNVLALKKSGGKEEEQKGETSVRFQ